MDLVKDKKNKRAPTKKGKARRSKTWNEKFKRVQALDLEGHKAGCEYQSGITMSKVKNY